MLALPGFVGARTLSAEDDPESGWPRRTVHYGLADMPALDAYFEEHAAHMRADGVQRFGDAIRSERRVFTAETRGVSQPAPDHCLNCDSVLRGQYCGICGQRASSRLISLWELIRDGLGDLLDMDSRLWRTLRALLVRPGYLTEEYLQGRRARYMPPFRMYLAFSLLFFVAAFFDTGDMPVKIQIGDDPAEQSEAGQAAEQLAADLAAGKIDEAELTQRAEALAGEAGQVTAQEEATTASSAGPASTAEDIESARRTCADVEIDLGDWMNQRLGEERIRGACERIVLDRGRNLSRILIDDLPTAMFLFLPVLAAVLKLLYPLSRRYYVEHLLFIVHYQSFVFLALTLQVASARLLDWVGVLTWISVLSGIAIGIYIPVYLHRAMRRVYRQGFAATFLKFIALSFAYFFAFVAMLLITLVVAALSV